MLIAALYLRPGPGAASRRRPTSSGESTRGSLRGLCTRARWRASSARSSMVAKKKHSAEAELLRVGGCTPLSVRCLVAAHVVGGRRLRRAAEEAGESLDVADIVVAPSSRRTCAPPCHPAC